MDKIGRFRIHRRLGSGSQGTVFLGEDPELQRRVAIKLLTRSPFSGDDTEEVLRQEAQTMSRLQHPNIVSVYEIGKHQGRPFLVCEYVEGRLLADLLKQDRPDIPQALDLADGMIEGICEAHRQGIVHRDLKPGNVMISDAGTPKIMDFGIARFLGSGPTDETGLSGTPRYMAPEYIKEGRFGTQSDVFSLGLILYEMMTGRPAFEGGSRKELLENLVSQPLRPASELNPQLDQRLDALLFKAIEKDPALRFETAVELHEALCSYRASGSGDPGTGPDTAGTVEFLLRRMRHQSDFPILSRSISALNQMVASEEKDAGALAGIVLKDFALTNKILKVVNSAYYSRFAGTIGTISRAIVVLGLEPIRAIATSLIFFEHLRDQAQAQDLKIQLTSALFSAVIGRRLATQSGMDEVEEGFLCAMLHDLGRILVTYYLHDESREISRLQLADELEPVQAEQRVLGVTYQEVGVAVARQWNFPATIINSMQPIRPGPIPRSVGETDSQRLIANFAHQTTQILAEESGGLTVAGLLERYHDSLGLDAGGFERLLQEARKEFLSLGQDRPDGSGATIMRRLMGKEAVATPTADADRGAAAGLWQPGLNTDSMADPAAPDGALPQRGEALLTNGLQEVTALLLGDYSLGQVANVVLESIYRAMAFDRVLLCLHDVRQGEMRAKLGFGADIERFTPRFRFPARYVADVFHAALKKGVDVYLTDAGDPKIAKDIPPWYRKISQARTLLIFPLAINGRPLGLIYADHPAVSGVEINSGQLNLLKALRNQLVLAFREKT